MSGRGERGHRRAYSDTWAFLELTQTEQGAVRDQGSFPLGIPEVSQGMEIDSGFVDFPVDATLSGRGHHQLHTCQASMPLPTSLRGLGHEGLQGLAPPLEVDATNSFSVPEDHVQGDDGRLLDGLDLPAPPPPPPSYGGALQSTSVSQGNKAGGPAAKLRVQKKSTITKRASTSMNGRSDQELMMLDPKNVKRILANRMSAAKSKLRRLQHANELEHKLAAAQEEFDQVSVQAEELSLDNSTLTQYNDKLVDMVPKLQAQLENHTSTCKLLVGEVLHMQRMLDLPLNVPDVAMPEGQGDSMLPIPSLLQPLSVTQR